VDLSGTWTALLLIWSCGQDGLKLAVLVASCMNKVYILFLPRFNVLYKPGGGTGFVPKTHISDTPEGTRICRKYAKLRMQLFPYIYTQAHIAHTVVCCSCD